MAKIQFLTQKYTNTFSAKLWTFETVCGSSQARKLHRYLGFPISDNDVRASLLSDSLFLAERICRAELGKVFPWDMHIPKKKWLSSLSSKYFYCVVGIFWRNQHHSRDPLLYYTNDIFPNFKLSRYQMCSAVRYGDGGSNCHQAAKGDIYQ